jgi:hypothetical protein
MPTSQDDVRSRGEDRKSPVLYQSDAIDPARKVTPSLTWQVLYARAQFDAYDKRYISLTAGKSAG